MVFKDRVRGESRDCPSVRCPVPSRATMDAVLVASDPRLAANGSATGFLTDDARAAIACCAVMIGMPKVCGPLTDVAQHVVQAEGVRRILTDGREFASADTCATFIVEKIGICQGKFAAVWENRGAASPAGVFPLRFAGKPIGQV